MKSVTWEGKTYGIPTNNETMALIWNADIFKRAGLDPDKPPATWDDVVAYSKQIHDKLGIAGYGLVARRTPATRRSASCRSSGPTAAARSTKPMPSPTYGEVRLNSAASKAALQASYDMYVRDKSVPVSALTNTAGREPGPVHRRPARHDDRASGRVRTHARPCRRRRRAPTRRRRRRVVANMRYGLIPTGPDGKRAVVFGGSNIHILKPEYVEGGKSTSRRPRRSSASGRARNGRLKIAWAGSNPGNLNGFKTKWMKERLDTIKFLDVTTSMLPNGIPFPVLPQAPEIMNIIVPDMLQNALTGKMTVDEAADDAAKKVEELMGGGGL